VDELADAVGVSRSTFFRNYGSKDGMVFADQERMLSQVESHLADAVEDHWLPWLGLR
jgi:AcrR family transcriptional regulator